MIQIRDLSFSYSKNKVFTGLNMSLEEGNVYGLLGQNGVGKTTLLKLMSGLLRSEKDTCDVNGFHPYKRQPAFFQDIFFLPEEPACPLGSVAHFADNNGSFYPGFNKEQFLACLDRFEIKPKKRFKDLSAGQQKKAHISYALSLNTRILLLDEPSNGMDIPSKSIFRSIVAGLINEERLMIISTHQVRDLENLIDPIIILDQSGVLLYASIEEIAARVCFLTAHDKYPEALYAEETPLGYSLVKANTEGIDTKVNLETLFNAVLMHKEWFRDHFKRG
ncbi:MAG: ATP-binding cassette domain-containing protein [Bacteroidales bacterium]|jgi:ABC-2 type transport system ATP-binding protein|nr:ATP-binding cassette domain-containing protein [Bacteroidales bacterium]MDD2264599.1 ATP-binding cassette domain-containing protein [Bacteroidales bacterium]MDD2831982.1 ATP-binding cassette domain-containing protein [Bacteroidales bacterium]MDD3208985.1 ATP-binding cassette domain-containing protein [Bacteroidales bacterium]MDD3697819.1 ATP-binding cassette domain-containing protein [Bacteroidales bacterium]